ncbi:hypothetical protein GE061_016789 [Apolygus lucorum]|uniref:Peptidase S1 domain-containing protein n=1 Tax=Apolygus lucorum TaxID=248454 RepID=A0A6A4JVJ1_APOLU|nr:hypothetical protein GE061_016789 [Apolygus lucorum]
MFDVRIYSIVASVLYLVDLAQCRDESMRIALGVIPARGSFPYLCSIVYKQVWIGDCSILTELFVIVSVSNFNRPISNKDDETKRFYNRMRDISVYAGTIYMNPSLYDEKTMPGLQKVKASSLYVAHNYPDLDRYTEIKSPEDANFNLTEILNVDVVGPAFNVGFLKVDKFEWSASLKPLPMFIDIDTLADAITDRIRALEKYPNINSHCKIATWHSPSERKVFHHVLFIPRKMCKQAWCNFNLNACLKFPRDDLICFKSAYWGEPCARDTGAALFCKFFSGPRSPSGNVFAILSTAFSCGNDNLPSVYTTMSPVLKFFKTVYEKYVPPEVPDFPPSP